MPIITDPRTSVVGAIRVSTDRQADAYGPDRQRAEIEQAARAEGLEIVHWVEEAVSGANHDRAAENDYYALARRHAGLNFMFSHPNRVGRHVEVIVGIARQLHALGATVWVAGLGNLRDSRNWRYFLRDAAEAESDYQNIVNQLIAGKRGKALRGMWPHGEPPWGYKLARDDRGRALHPEPVPELAAVVQRVFDLAETQGKVQIAATLAAEGWPTKSAGGARGATEWTPKAVSNILKNERYTGRAIYQGIELIYEPIISPEQFARVQTRVKLRKTARQPRGAVSDLWTGHLRCAECGSSIGRDTSLNDQKRRYVYYRCWRGKLGPNSTRAGQRCSHSKTYKGEWLDDVVWPLLVSYLSDPARLPELLPPDAPVSSGPPLMRVQELEAAIARAWEPFAAGKISQEIAERLAAPYQQQLEQLRAEYAPQASEQPDYDALAHQFADALARVESQAERRELLDLLDVQVYILAGEVTRVQVAAP